MSARTIHLLLPALVLAACGSQGNGFHYPLIMQQEHAVRIIRPALQGLETREELVQVDAVTAEPSVVVFWSNEATGERGAAVADGDPRYWSALVPLVLGPNPVRLERIAAGGPGGDAFVVVILQD